MGEGEVPCREILDLIASRGYNGFGCAEWEKKWHPEIEEPEIALPQHARVLHKWMAGVGGVGIFLEEGRTREARCIAPSYTLARGPVFGAKLTVCRAFDKSFGL